MNRVVLLESTIVKKGGWVYTVMDSRVMGGPLYVSTCHVRVRIRGRLYLVSSALVGE